VEALATRLAVPIVAEGRYNTPQLVQRAFAVGAHAVVVGTMITNPREITRLFVRDGVPS
jgi:putative N-acetylmannosamine-6-phosphate epimerase